MFNVKNENSYWLFSAAPTLTQTVVQLTLTALNKFLADDPLLKIISHNKIDRGKSGDLSLFCV